MIYYRTIRLHEILNGSAIVKDLPYGEYVVTEMETLRYVCVGDLVQQAVINEENKTAVVKFQNKLVKLLKSRYNEIYENRKVEIERAGSSHRPAEMGRSLPCSALGIWSFIQCMGPA